MTTIIIKPSSKAEIILKEGVIYNLDEVVIPLPELTILANEDGYKWLASIFEHMAKRKVNMFAGDPDDHEHVDATSKPFNSTLSDIVHIRLGTITKDNRRMVLKKYGVSRSKRKTESILDRYKIVMKVARRVVRQSEKRRRQKGGGHKTRRT